MPKNALFMEKLQKFAKNEGFCRQLGTPPQDLEFPIENSWLRHYSTPFF